MSYEWITLNGSCDLCLALEGHHEEEPQRPHIKCDCDIFQESWSPEPGTCWAELDDDDLYENGFVTINVHVYKICADGDEVEGHTDIEQTFDEWYEAFIEDPNGEEWDEFHEELDKLKDGMCVHELEWACTQFVDPTPP